MQQQWRNGSGGAAVGDGGGAAAVSAAMERRMTNCAMGTAGVALGSVARMYSDGERWVERRGRGCRFVGRRWLRKRHGRRSASCLMIFFVFGFVCFVGCWCVGAAAQGTSAAQRAGLIPPLEVSRPGDSLSTPGDEVAILDDGPRGANAAVEVEVGVGDVVGALTRARGSSVGTSAAARGRGARAER